MAKKTTRFGVQIVEKVYKVNGAELSAAIQSTGLTQAQVAEQAGYKGASRICHLCRATTSEVTGKSLSAILAVLHNHGVVVTGFDWELSETEGA